MIINRPKPSNVISIISYKSIEDAIKESKLTKKYIAERLGISVQWLNKLLKEPRRINIEQLESILSLIGYKVEVYITN